ncbi:Ribosome production factor 2 [Frankliniella occidentalis]|uniref:Ribosome production factor 2 homolog n=1 Tax=Frankliniella occidentalis TaxID=133901 RepID=A0A6J1S8R8_FRAOC|nr:ribosome production factor 2 homolog [Frankliniella occidentalis]KAE8745911.1 Ribosome production factor 2 [Frankliniella occidentalis]
MPVLQRIKKPTTHKGKKVLLSKEPQVIENTKQTFLLKGRKTGGIINDCLKDFFSLKKPDAVMLSQKNDILPFEDASFLEQSGKKRDANLFIFGSHTKKRPNNLIIGRLYDYQLLDMVELGVENFTSMIEFKNEKVGLGLKPCLVFNGDLWSQHHEYQRLKNLLVDLFHRETASAVRLQGIEHVIAFTAVEGKIYMKSYRILLKKSGQRTPRIELEEIGPSAEMKLRRTKLASDDLLKTACKQPKELKIKKKKNVTKDNLGTTHGRIHVPKQKIDKLQTRKMKGLKKTSAERKEDRAALKKRRAEQEASGISTKRLRSQS